MKDNPLEIKPITFASLEDSDDLFDLKLTTTTEISKDMLEIPVWRLINKFYTSKNATNRPNTFHKLIALISNAAVTHQKIEFLLSINLINNLVSQEKHFGRSVYSGSELSAFFAKAKKDKVLIEVSPPQSPRKGKNPVAGTYRINIKEVVDHISFHSSMDTSPKNSTEYKFENEFKMKNESEFAQIKPPPFLSKVEEQPKNEKINDESPIFFSNDGLFEGTYWLRVSKESESKIRGYHDDLISKIEALPDVGSKKSSHDDFATELNRVLFQNDYALFNDWGELCGFYAVDRSEVEEIIQKCIAKRFTDQEGLFSHNGPIATSAFATIISRYDSRLSSMPNISPKRRYCTPNEWLIYLKVSKALVDRSEQEIFGELMDTEVETKGVYTEEEFKVYKAVESREREEYLQELRRSLKFQQTVEGV